MHALVQHYHFAHPVHALPTPTACPLQNCIICTFLNRRGLLADDVYQGDLAFGRLMRTHLPFMHEGYWLWAK
jgi:hypothetical protein